MAIKNRTQREDILKVTGSSVEVVAGGKLLDPYMNQVVYKEHKPHIQFIQVPGFAKVEYQFLISGKGRVNVEYSSFKAKDQELEFSL